MKITYISEQDCSNQDESSGTAFWIANSLRAAELDLQTIHVPTVLRLLSPLKEIAFRSKKMWLKYIKKTYLDPDLFTARAKHIAEMVRQPVLHKKPDVILTALTPLSGAYLETTIPIVYWSDSVYTACSVFYPQYRFHDPDTTWDAFEVTDACLHNARLLVFSSKWAARSAIELHGVKKEKVHVIPFGANLKVTHTVDDVKEMIKARPHDCIKLLFVGTQWFRKGGDVVLLIAEALHAAHHRVEVTLVGSKPKNTNLPDYVKYIPFISKNTEAGREAIKRLYQENHFLFVPSRAEAFGIVFCEANAFGVPCISTYVGGIGEIIKDDINGKTFSLEATVKDYCDYIVNAVQPEYYENLALSAFNEYQTRLNWNTAAQQMRKLLYSEII